jgi:hypothetical protein
MEFPAWGDMLVSGENVAWDSAHALYQASLLAQLGDPGRFLAEYVNEAKLQTWGWLISWGFVWMHPSARDDAASAVQSLTQWLVLLASCQSGAPIIVPISNLSHDRH